MPVDDPGYIYLTRKPAVVHGPDALNQRGMLAVDCRPTAPQRQINFHICVGGVGGVWGGHEKISLKKSDLTSCLDSADWPVSAAAKATEMQHGT